MEGYKGFCQVDDKIQMLIMHKWIIEKYASWRKFFFSFLLLHNALSLRGFFVVINGATLVSCFVPYHYYIISFFDCVVLYIAYAMFLLLLFVR